MPGRGPTALGQACETPREYFENGLEGMITIAATVADFRFAKINNVNFKNTNLTGANFAGSEVVSSNFLNSDMTKTYVSGGFFVVNDLSNSIITDANWRGVILAYMPQDEIDQMAKRRTWM